MLCTVGWGQMTRCHVWHQSLPPAMSHGFRMASARDSPHLPHQVHPAAVTKRKNQRYGRPKESKASTGFLVTGMMMHATWTAFKALQSVYWQSTVRQHDWFQITCNDPVRSLHGDLGDGRTTVSTVSTQISQRPTELTGERVHMHIWNISCIIPN